MTTIAVVKKNGYAAIAADTLTMWGSMKESATHIANSSKIVKCGESFLAFTGSSAFQLVVKHWLAENKDKPELNNVDNIFNFWLSFHAQLKDRYFIREVDDERDPFESSRMNILIANPYGIFTVGVLRTVTEYNMFTSLGSGCDYAIGAMQAIYGDVSKSAEDIAEIGITVAAEFDNGTGLPVEIYKVKLK